MARFYFGSFILFLLILVSIASFQNDIYRSGLMTRPLNCGEFILGLISSFYLFGGLGTFNYLCTGNSDYGRGELTLRGIELSSDLSLITYRNLCNSLAQADFGTTIDNEGSASAFRIFNGNAGFCFIGSNCPVKNELNRFNGNISHTLCYLYCFTGGCDLYG